MARKNHITNLTELLLQCMAQPDPMLSMLEWLCGELMEAEVSQQLGAEKVNVPAAATGIAVATVLGGWIQGWAPCISWYPRFAKETTYRFLSPSASEVRQL